MMQTEAETAAKQADVQFSAAVRQSLYGDDQTPGYLATQGSAALDGAKGADEALEKTRQQISNSLDNRARRMFDPVAASRIESARGKMAGHTARQRELASAAASAARISEFADDATAAAMDDPRAIAQAIAGATMEARELATKAGLDADTIKSQVQEVETGIHVRVIDRILSNNAPAQAELYYKSQRDNIDGKQRGAIERSILAAKNRQVAELRDDVSNAVAMLDAGKTPAGLGRLSAAVAGTKLAPALNDAIADREHMAAFNSKPIQERAADWRTLNSQDEYTASDFRRLQKMGKAYLGTVQRLQAGDGLAVAAESGMIGAPSEIDWQAPETLRARARQAELASRGLGVPVSPLTPAEADGLANALDRSTAAATGGLLSSLREGFGRDGANEIAAVLTKGKKPELGPAILASEYAPQTAIDIIQGGKAKRETGSNLELPATDKRDAITAVIGNTFEGTDAEPLAAFVAAADSLYAARRIPGGDLTFDADTYEQALRDAAGGIVEFNGRNVIPPRPGMDSDAIEDVLNVIQDSEDLAELGNGVPVVGDGSPVPADRLFAPSGMFRSGLGGQLVSVGPGVYRVMIPGAGFVQTEAGGYYELDLGRSMAGR
jgi:hypothetical protein